MDPGQKRCPRLGPRRRASAVRAASGDDLPAPFRRHTVAVSVAPAIAPAITFVVAASCLLSSALAVRAFAVCAPAAALPPSEVSLSAGAVIPRGEFETRDLANVGFVLSGGYGFYLCRRLQLGLTVAHLGLTGDEIAGSGIERYNRRFTLLQGVAFARMQLLPGATSPYVKAALGAQRWGERFLVRETSGGDADYLAAQKADGTDFGHGVGLGCQVRIGQRLCVLLEAMWHRVDRHEARTWRYTEARAGFVFQLGPGGAGAGESGAGDSRVGTSGAGDPGIGSAHGRRR